MIVFQEVFKELTLSSFILQLFKIVFHKFFKEYNASSSFHHLFRMMFKNFSRIFPILQFFMNYVLTHSKNCSCRKVHEVGLRQTKYSS